MKKKILSICLVAVIAVMSIAGASLAYLTDTDDADNVFEVGNVQIELVEQQRNENGELEAFEDDKTLMPIVGSAQGEKDGYGLPTAKNYVDKIVNVKNTGKSDAYVRVIVAVPAGLDNSTDAMSVIHWNVGNRFSPDKQYVDGYTNPGYADIEWKFVEEITIDGVAYNTYCFTYTEALTAGATTECAAITGFYLDKNVDNYVNDEGKVVYTLNGKDINYDLANGVTVPVFAQAVQAAGFDSAEEAFTNAGLPTNPWAE
ncbi:MAG: hypothetical protein IJC36_00730 [Clostridia bacterium]|nr:hypothetical protein [Clostridia bacterium]